MNPLIMLFLCVGTLCGQSNVLLEQYKHTEDLAEKSAVLESLLLHTYGPNNPFLELPYTIEWCIDISKKITISANASTNSHDIACAVYSQNALAKLDQAISTLLICFVNETPKEDAIKELLTLTHECTTWFTAHVPAATLLSPAAEKIAIQHKRFFMISPSIIGTALHFLSLGAAGLWALYALKKIHTYFTSANHELINDLEDNQQEATTELIELNNQINKLVTERAKEQNIPPVKIAPIQETGPRVNPILHPMKFVRRAWRAWNNKRSAKKQKALLDQVVKNPALIEEFNSAMAHIQN